jgi:hypothetical protein
LSCLCYCLCRHLCRHLCPTVSTYLTIFLTIFCYHLCLTVSCPALFYLSTISSHHFCHLRPTVSIYSINHLPSSETPRHTCCAQLPNS